MNKHLLTGKFTISNKKAWKRSKHPSTGDWLNCSLKLPGGWQGGVHNDRPVANPDQWDQDLREWSGHLNLAGSLQCPARLDSHWVSLPRTFTQWKPGTYQQHAGRCVQQLPFLWMKENVFSCMCIEYFWKDTLKETGIIRVALGKRD